MPFLVSVSYLFNLKLANSTDGLLARAHRNYEPTTTEPGSSEIPGRGVN